jgi:hypothetical protein
VPGKDDLPLSGAVCLLHYARMLKEHGFPPSTWEELTDSLDFHIASYRERPAALRSSDIAQELTQVLLASRPLLKELESLSHIARCAILDAKAYTMPGVTDDPWELKRSLRELVQRADRAAKQVPSDSGGRPSNDAFRNLLLSLGRCWRAGFPEGKGITKSQDAYRGPLLKFVMAVLRSADERLGKISHPSEQQIGRELFAMRKRTDAAAKRGTHKITIRNAAK